MRRNRIKVWEVLQQELPEPSLSPEEVWQKTGGVCGSKQVILSGIKYTLETEDSDEEISIIIDNWIYSSETNDDMFCGHSKLLLVGPVGYYSKSGFTTFPPQNVRMESFIEYLENNNSLSGIRIVNSKGESIIEVDTMFFDDYYSTAHVAYHPENLPINK